VVRAVETTLQELLEGTKQYQVPLYQRTYSWTKDQLHRLWSDVVTLAEDRVEKPEATHFIGSLVLAPSPANGPAGVQEFLVVDGQQRLTTLSILLCAIRDHRAETEDPLHRDRLNEQYLLNKWQSGSQRLKLLPTQADRPSYLACVDATPQAGGGDAIGAAYRFFRAELANSDDPDDVQDIQRIENAVIGGLAVVSVTAQPGDNVHRIFESLNNTGLGLTQADLLRNYLFMRLGSRGEAVYDSLWLPLQQSLSSAELELLFWLDLVHRDARAKQTETYAAQQQRLERLDVAGIEDEVVRFARLGALLRTILTPGSEPDPEVRRRLERLDAWGTRTVYPLLLFLLDARDQGRADDAEVARAIAYVESYLVRRLLIGRATAGINRVLLAVVTEMKRDRPVDEAVRDYLSGGRRHWATDEDVRAGVRSGAFYWNGKAHQKALVLRWLEESYGSKEPVDFTGLTIEHVLPQTLTAEWREMLRAGLAPGEDVDEIYRSSVHTLGNLTLTGYNAALSNKPFAAKRDLLRASGLMMNQRIAAAESWTRAEIEERAAELAERAVTLWPGPAAAGTEDEAGAVAWQLLTRALTELPAGTWTTYGDLAELLGSHPVPVGMRLANHPVPNAHRVLQVTGTVSAGFKWPDPTCTDDPIALLRAEGVVFDASLRADPAQRVTAVELAELAGVAADDIGAAVPDPHAEDVEARARFVDQLSAMQSPAVVHGTLALLVDWTNLGGHLLFGRARETSCFLMATAATDGAPAVWPVTLYPSGRIEVVFQHLAVRPPFDDRTLRDEFRRRLNEVDGVSLAESKIAMRPGAPLSVVAAEATRHRLVEALVWFLDQVRAAAPTERVG
jgi:alkylated DNA nucleotide flippase Atl1